MAKEMTSAFKRVAACDWLGCLATEALAKPHEYQ